MEEPWTHGPAIHNKIDSGQVRLVNGFQDMLTRTSAEAFGGDPKRIMVFGQSAGAASIDYMVSFLSCRISFSVVGDD
jgi:hypothetical protein